MSFQNMLLGQMARLRLWKNSEKYMKNCTTLLDLVRKWIRSLIGASSLEEANKVTGSVVKEAAKLMKAGKSDVSGGFASDVILDAPDLMFDHLASYLFSEVMWTKTEQ
jgi:hypothetical protein